MPKGQDKLKKWPTTELRIVSHTSQKTTGLGAGQTITRRSLRGKSPDGTLVSVPITKDQADRLAASGVTKA